VRLTSSVVFVGLVCCLIGLGSARVAPDVFVAQSQAPVVITRIYSGSDGQTHAEDIDVKMLPADAGGQLSEAVRITGLQFRRLPPGFFRDWHPVSRRQYVITLSGRGEVELASGRTIRSEPGHVFLAEDLTGQGHITRVLGTEDHVLLYLSVGEP